MKRKIYLVDTNGYRFLLSDNGEIRRVLTDDKDPDMYDVPIDQYMAAIEDDSSWEEYEESAEELLNGNEILAEIEVEWLG